MEKGRLETFSDGVIAILITIMVLELHSPDGTDWHALREEGPTLLAYLLSFVYLGIYWNNHHHMLAVCKRVTGGILWANLHLLFWLSLVPFMTEWMSQNDFKPVPVAAYGIVLLLAGVAYWALQTMLVRVAGEGSVLARAVGADLKGKISPAIYIAGIALTAVDHWLGIAAYTVVALMWLVPDRRVERAVSQEPPS